MKTNCISLNGKTLNFPNSLLGKPLNSYQPNIPDEIHKVKKTIINQFILPLCNDNWKEIKENMYNISRLKNKIKFLKSTYKDSDLTYFEQILDFVIITFSEHLNLENLEKKIYSGNKQNAASLIQKIKYIRLKAEYELYNTILGKPDPKEKYNENVINKIKTLLQNENITFGEIKQQIQK